MLLLIFFCGCKRNIDNYVRDSHSILNKNEIQKLDSIYRAHERRTSNEIVLITTNSFSPEENLYAYSVKLFNSVGIGKKAKNNGVLIVLCPTCKRIEIITGRGTEKVLKDSIVQDVMNTVILPTIRTEGYYRGIYDGSTAIVNFLEQPENKIE